MDRSETESEEEPTSQRQGKAAKGKSCKGYLYFSSSLKSKSRNPRCIGISRTLQQVPGYIVGQTEMEASKEGRDLTDFNYGCVGYSVYLDRIGKDRVADNQGAKAELPVCVGLEILVDRRLSAGEPAPASAPAHIHNREVPGYIVGQTEMEASKEGRDLTDFNYGCVGYSVYLDRIGKDHVADNQGAKAELPVCVGLEILVDRRLSADEPAPASAPAHIHNREGCHLSKWFTRNANLVASGVARNVRRVGNSIKETLDDVLYPYRKRPK
ncbi:hypothetical protein CFP56_039157 [Quercus suber]|uniref:DUF8204 domain-containing protein n=1 Tax=Quercus suber TaxID=58331 RepID=A0AAW0J1J2_QUESU